MKMCNFLRISQDYGIWHAFLRLKRWAILICPSGTSVSEFSKCIKLDLHCRGRFFLGRKRRIGEICHPVNTMKSSIEKPMARTGAIAVAIACGLVCALRGADEDEAAGGITADDLLRHIRT